MSWFVVGSSDLSGSQGPQCSYSRERRRALYKSDQTFFCQRMYIYVYGTAEDNGDNKIVILHGSRWLRRSIVK